METSESNVPFIDQSFPVNKCLGVGMYASLMGTFDIPAPANYLGSISVGENISTVVDRTNPWVFPS